MKTLNRRILAVSLLLAVGASCSSDNPFGSGGNKERACPAVQDYASAISGIDSSNYESMKTGLAAAHTASATIKANAPSRVYSALVTIDRIDGNTVNIDEQAERASALDLANRWIHDVCRLDITM